MADGMAVRLADKVRRINAGAANPLLAFLAGPHADRVAACWPAPHDRFFALPAARRHAAAILLADEQADLAALARMLERHKDADLARRLTARDHPPAGLMKAMARMGETQWQMADYGVFLDLFQDEQAASVLRHMAEIRPEKLALIGALPGGLRDAKVVAQVPSLQAARDLGLAFRLASSIHGARSERERAEQWRRAKSAGILFAMAADSLAPQRFGGAPDPPVLPTAFELVSSRKQLVSVALEFQNCLRDFCHDLAMGRMRVYVWRVIPAVALALRWDAAGWRLAEAENKANMEMSEDQLRDLVAALASAGVRTGPGLTSLARRLVAHPNGVAEVIGDSFAERLELGELWD